MINLMTMEAPIVHPLMNPFTPTGAKIRDPVSAVMDSTGFGILDGTNGE